MCRLTNSGQYTQKQHVIQQTTQAAPKTSAVIENMDETELLRLQNRCHEVMEALTQVDRQTPINVLLLWRVKEVRNLWMHIFRKQTYESVGLEVIQAENFWQQQNPPAL